MKKIFLFSLILSSTFSFADFLPSSFTANFSQEYVSSLKGKIKKGNGSIDYKYPSNIRFETTNPTHVLYVTNGVKSWYYTYPFIDGEQGELTESNSKDGQGLFTKFFDSLKNGLSSNNMYDVKKETDSFFVTFKPKSAKEVGMKMAKLIFKTGKNDFSNLEAIEIEFLDSKKSTMKLTEMKVNILIDSSRFNFQAPINTKKALQKN